jgi:hypothetical protein
MNNDNKQLTFIYKYSYNTDSQDIFSSDQSMLFGSICRRAYVTFSSQETGRIWSNILIQICTCCISLGHVTMTHVFVTEHTKSCSFHD